LKACIFVKVDDLRITGSKKYKTDFQTGRIISFTLLSFNKGQLS